MPAISWWSAQWTVRSDLVSFSQNIKNAGRIFSDFSCCTLIENGYKRDRRAMRIAWVSLFIQVLFYSFCRFGTTCWNDLNYIVACVFVMILISYRQIYFRLLNSQLIHRENFFALFLCNVNMEAIFNSFFLFLDKNEKKIITCWKISRSSSSVKTLINQLSLSYQQQRPFDKTQRGASRSSKKAVYFILLSKSSGLMSVKWKLIDC